MLGHQPPAAPSAVRVPRRGRSWIATTLGVLVALELLGLAVTGVWLWFNYMPSTGPSGKQTARSVHQLLATAATLKVGAWAILTLVDRVAARRRTTLVLAALFAGMVVASVTGRLLPWDALAVWAPFDTPIHGYGELFPPSGDVRFVLIGSQEVSTEAFGRVVLAHLGVSFVVTAPLTWLAGVAVVRRLRPRHPTDGDRVHTTTAPEERPSAV